MTTPDPLAEWIDHLPGVTSAFGVTFGELMVPVSAIRQHFRAASSQPEPLHPIDEAFVRELEDDGEDELAAGLRSRLTPSQPEPLDVERFLVRLARVDRLVALLAAEYARLSETPR